MAIKKGTISTGTDGNKYRWLGAQWGRVTKSGKTGKMAKKSIASGLTRKANKLSNLKTKKIARKTNKGKAKSSVQWFKDTIEKSLDKYRSVSKPKVGGMYTFVYDAKFKKTLPWWDKHPLVILLGPAKGGFLGLNLHYLSPAERDKFFTAMLKFTGKKDPDLLTEKDLFDIDWGKVKKIPMIEKTVHHYLYPHVKTKILEVSPTEWENSIYLPTASFQGASQKQVWSN